MATDIKEHLCKILLFSACDDQELTALLENAHIHHLAVDECLFEEESPSEKFYVLLQGSVGVYHGRPDGRTVLVKIFRAPCVFGEMELLANLPRQEFVRAMLPSEVLAIQSEAFLDLLRRNVAFCYEMLRDLSIRFCIAAYSARTLAFEPVKNRLAELLLSLAEAHGKPCDKGVMLRGSLSYPELAAKLGVSERSVERALGEFLRAGVVHRHKGHLVVGSMDALRSHLEDARLGLSVSMDSSR